jgi:oligosaccharide repeat unit polymerase
MFELSCVLIILVAGGAGVSAFLATRDPLHPAVFVSPLFAYFYGLWPLVLNRDGQLEGVLHRSYLQHTSFVFLVAIAAMFIGMLHGVRHLRGAPAAALNPFGDLLTPRMSRRLTHLALFMGALSVIAFYLQLDNVGGFVSAYSRGKGGGRAESGLIGEAVLLSFPALLALALSVYADGRRVTWLHITMALFIVSPHLIQGTLGGRRGPLFLVLTTLLFSWLIAKGKRPSLSAIVMSVCAIGFAVIFVASQRDRIYIGSQEAFDYSRVLQGDGLAPEAIDAGNSYVTAISNIVAADFYDDHYWGYRYFVTFFIRPIPKEIWPTKYEDMGAEWLELYGTGSEASRFTNSIGFSLPTGVSGGSIADGYVEFSWGVALMFFVIGRLFAASYVRHRLEGGFWSIIFFTMLALSIYLPTQSFSAWMLRLMFMSGFAYLIWRAAIGPVSHVPQDSDPAPAPRRGGR